MIFGMSSPTHVPRDFLPRQAGAPSRGPLVRAMLLPAVASVLLASVSAFADTPNAELDSVLAALAQRRHGHALYSEQIESALFKRPLHASGEMFFDAPDRLEKKTLVPAAEDLLVEGDVVTIVRGTHRTSMRLSDYPRLSPLLNGIRATLAGDRSALEKAFQLAFKANGADWELTLQPLPTENRPVYKEIQIRGVDGIVHSISLDRATGERTTLTLTEPAGS